MIRLYLALFNLDLVAGSGWKLNIWFFASEMNESVEQSSSAQRGIRIQAPLVSPIEIYPLFLSSSRLIIFSCFYHCYPFSSQLSYPWKLSSFLRVISLSSAFLGFSWTPTSRISSLRFSFREFLVKQWWVLSKCAVI